ncbi:hypothetical protein [Pectinatus haikarae]|uniref:Uncharacterized protein n=1 Tax=Pectinatus haikarae TaxID=349096 RepID=A0ABT9YAK8_9FIRM|nr:hypothetical protein [Pectinatus haikarae]MDQ0204880.1 hypothetical protein [Pectinatus haikarae]
MSNLAISTVEKLLNNADTLSSATSAESSSAAGSSSSSNNVFTDSSAAAPAYSLSQGLVNIINGSASASSSDPLLSNVYSSLSTLSAASKLSAANFQKMQDINSSSSVQSITSQMSTLLFSLNGNSAKNTNTVYQTLLNGVSSAKKLSVMLKSDPSGETLKNAVSQIRSSQSNT